MDGMNIFTVLVKLTRNKCGVFELALGLPGRLNLPQFASFCHFAKTS
jgi:hypothetical protein